MRPSPADPALPVLIKGAAAIGAALGVSAAEAQRLHQLGMIPTFRRGGTPYATAGALAEYQRLEAVGALLNENI